VGKKFGAEYLNDFRFFVFQHAGSIFFKLYLHSRIRPNKTFARQQLTAPQVLPVRQKPTTSNP